jgi:hypothetical protein
MLKLPVLGKTKSDVTAEVLAHLVAVVRTESDGIPYLCSPVLCLSVAE